MKKKNFYKGKRILKPIIIGAFVTAAGIAALFSSSSSDSAGGDLIIEEASTQKASADKASIEKASTADEASEAAMPEETTSSSGVVVVYICGEVISPGLYECSADKRVADVVKLAGGLTPDADDTCVNMARLVTDAEQIIIRKKGESAPDLQESGAGEASSISQGAGLININTADEAALKSLPGIGEQKAKAIISYRQGGNKFTKPEDIMNVSGIKDGAFSKIKDLITV